MSRSTRVQKLEQKNGDGFQVVLPKGLDADGRETNLAPDNDRLVQVRYSHGGKVENVDRLEDEEFAALESRATSAGRAAFPGAIILPLKTRDIL